MSQAQQIIVQSGQADDIEYIRLPEVKKITSLGHSKIYAMIKDGQFPDRVSLGGNAVAWVRHEVQAWARAQLEASRRPASNQD